MKKQYLNHSMQSAFGGSDNCIFSRKVLSTVVFCRNNFWCQKSTEIFCLRCYYWNETSQCIWHQYTTRLRWMCTFTPTWCPVTSIHHCVEVKYRLRPLNYFNNGVPSLAGVEKLWSRLNVIWKGMS